VLFLASLGLAQDYEFNLVKRGYQILDPKTGHVLPPSLNTFKRGPTRHYTRPEEQKKPHEFFPSHHFSLINADKLSGPAIEEKRYYTSHDRFSFDSDGDDFFFPGSENEEASVNHHYDEHFEYHPDHHDTYDHQSYRPEKISHQDSTRHSLGTFGSFFDNHAANFDVIVSPANSHQHRPHKVFKKQVTAPSYYHEDVPTRYSSSTHSSSSGGGRRRPRPQEQSLQSHQPHKTRKKYPYYGRKKRSPLELLDPRTGRTIKRPVIKYRGHRQSSRLPLRGGRGLKLTSNTRSNRHLSNEIRSKRRQPAVAVTHHGYFATTSSSGDRGKEGNSIRSERNIAVPILNDDTDINRFRRPNLGGEYYSVYSGLPVYKYTKKHPHGYHGKRRKRNAPDTAELDDQSTFKRNAQWVILNPWTGRNVDQEAKELDLEGEESAKEESQLQHSGDDLLGEIEGVNSEARTVRNDQQADATQLSQSQLDRYRHRYHKKYPYTG